MGPPKAAQVPDFTAPPFPGFVPCRCLSLFSLRPLRTPLPFLWVGSPALLSLLLSAPTSVSVVSPLAVSCAEGPLLNLLLCPELLLPTLSLPQPPVSPSFCTRVSPFPPFSVFAGLWVSDPHPALMALCLELLKQCEWWGVRVGPESARRLAAAKAPWGWRWGEGWHWGRGLWASQRRGQGGRGQAIWQRWEWGAFLL